MAADRFSRRWGVRGAIAVAAWASTAAVVPLSGVSPTTGTGQRRSLRSSLPGPGEGVGNYDSRCVGAGDFGGNWHGVAVVRIACINASKGATVEVVEALLWRSRRFSQRQTACATRSKATVPSAAVARSDCCSSQFGLLDH